MLVQAQFGGSKYHAVKAETKQDSICMERGHVSTGSVTSTLAYCPPYTIDTDSTTITVFPACNSYSYTCQRCRRSITEYEKESRIVTWRKEK